MTDELELRGLYRGVNDGSASNGSSNSGVGGDCSKERAATAAAPLLQTSTLVAGAATITAGTTTPTSAKKPAAVMPSAASDWRSAFRVPMLSPDGKLVGYKQNSSMLRRQMQVSMPFSDVDSATPPESPMMMNNYSHSGGGAEDFLNASQDPFAGFPDEENQLPGYLLGPVVGRGGFSSVHKALHVATSLSVAVKVIDKTRMRDPKDRDRVDREMRVMRQLSGHIGIAQLLECAETPQYLYIIMEYCAGGSLLDYVREKRKLSENEACLLFQQLLAALQHCHSRGVVHRDIKLENVLLDGHGGVKLIDFGLCGYYVPDKPLRCHCGSPSYAAPEIVARKDYMAGPVDVWSAGVVLYAMLAGYLPFQAKDKKSLSTKIIKATWTPPSYASTTALDLLERMLTLDPCERICLNKIWEHPWVVGGPRWEGNAEGPNGLMLTSVDPEVADAWVHQIASQQGEQGGMTMATLLRALRLKECNAMTAGYHLLCQAKISTNETNNSQYNYGESNILYDDKSAAVNGCEAKSETKSGESCVTAATSSDLDIFI
jgi:5'-AMP-activated protein kinase catalytic alpha subunit